MQFKHYMFSIIYLVIRASERQTAYYTFKFTNLILRLENTPRVGTVNFVQVNEQNGNCMFFCQSSAKNHFLRNQ